MAIDIGAEATPRGSTAPNSRTLIGLDNPANATGTITSVEIYGRNEILEGFRVGTFYLVSGNDYKCRDSEAVGNIYPGSKVTKAVTIEVEAGDFIGCYFTGYGAIERDTSGFVGLCLVAGEYIDPDDQATYTIYADDAISLYGTGTEAGPAGQSKGIIIG